MTVNYADWYWTHRGSDRVYSSARRAFVPRTDPSFLAWQASRRAFGLIDEPTTCNTKTEMLAAVRAARPSRAEINEERDRRIAQPVEVTVDGETFRVDMAGGGRAAIAELRGEALARKAVGIETTFSFRDADNVDHSLSPDQMIAVGLQVAAAIEAVHKAARALKDRKLTPRDMTADQWWPVKTVG